MKNKTLSILKSLSYIISYILGIIIISPITNILFKEGFYKPAAFVLDGLMELIMVVIITAIFLKFIDKESYFPFRFKLEGQTRYFFKGSFLAVIAVFVGFVIITRLSREVILYDPSGLDYLVGCFISFFITALVEEIIFRAYIFDNLKKNFSLSMSLLISSILFTLLHLLNGGISFIPVVNIFIAGILLGMFYYITKNIWLSVGFHFMWNFTMTILGFEVSGASYPSVFTLHFEEMNAFNGGYFGFEGSYICTVILILCIISVIYKNYKSFKRI